MPKNESNIKLSILLSINKLEQFVVQHRDTLLMCPHRNILDERVLQMKSVESLMEVKVMLVSDTSQLFSSPFNNAL